MTTIIHEERAHCPRQVRDRRFIITGFLDRSGRDGKPDWCWVGQIDDEADATQHGSYPSSVEAHVGMLTDRMRWVESCALEIFRATHTQGM